MIKMNNVMILFNPKHRRALAMAAAAALLAALLLGGLWFKSLSNPADTYTSSGLQAPVSFTFTQALPQTVPLDGRKVSLGQQLFHDPRLSKDDTISCASCHSLNTGGVDNRARSIGVAGGVGSINAPSVLNSGLNFVQFWDGRAPTLEAQIEGPVNHPLEMGSNWALVTQKLSADAHYAESFAALYAQGITPANIKDAIATFERSLITPNSRFDKFLSGDTAVLNAQEKHGYELFQSYGCASCHQGQNLGGNMFEKMGLMGDYFANRGKLTEADKGRFNVTHDVQNLYEFRVPSLRNVALTAPYFHDGYAQTLEQAVAIMAKYQLGRPMPEADLNAIVAFLRSLTGQSLEQPL
jgi:cytochrome c peroxidase